MSQDTITNFIEPIDNVLAWAKDVLEADSYWDIIYRTDAYSWDEIYNVIAYAAIPTCVIAYKGGKYQNQPRAVRKFSVFVAEREWRDKEQAEETMSAVVTKVISLLDHNLALTPAGDETTALVRVVGDNYVPMQWSGITAYELQFEVEDY